MSKRKLQIWFSNQQEKMTVTNTLRNLVRKAILTTLELEEQEGSFEVSVTFVDNERIHVLNKQYRNVDRATDVLSFPLQGDDDSEPSYSTGCIALGDIVLSLERAMEQAELYGHSADREVAYLTSHSTLHLLGYDHERSEDEDTYMRKQQDEVMKRMGLEVH